MCAFGLALKEGLAVMPARNPDERALIARIGAASLHAKVANATQHTAPARAAFNSRFEREVDPDGVLPPEERARRAAHARRAHFQRMALKSAQLRRKRGKNPPPVSPERPAQGDPGSTGAAA